MKFFFYLLLPLTLFGQNDTVIDKGIYTVLFSQKYKQPLSVQYTVTPINSISDRAGLDFHIEPGVQTTTSKDYRSNEFDKGHLAPAETFSDSDEHLKKTFTYINCALQNFSLNRGVWKLLEMKERSWSEKEPIIVQVQLLFDNRKAKSTTGALIPLGFFKTLIFTKSKKQLTFYFPNQPCTNNIKDYLLNNKNMAKQTKDSLLQANGRGYVSGVWLTPLQAKGLADMLRISISQLEGILPAKPSAEQKNYLEALKKRLHDADIIAGQ